MSATPYTTIKPLKISCDTPIAVPSNILESRSTFGGNTHTNFHYISSITPHAPFRIKNRIDIHLQDLPPGR